MHIYCSDGLWWCYKIKLPKKTFYWLWQASFAYLAINYIIKIFFKLDLTVELLVVLVVFNVWALIYGPKIGPLTKIEKTFK